MKTAGGAASQIRTGVRAWAYVDIARPDHWIKNLFVLPGCAVALSIDQTARASFSWASFAVGLVAVCLISSSNYVLNEILDATTDRAHPHKSARPVAAGLVPVAAAYFEWIVLAAAALGLGWLVSPAFTLSLAGLWIAGLVYNIPPLRWKDVAFLDVLTEGFTNPLRMLAGWYLTGSAALPITSLLISYWMVGCYFMAIKRYAEFREFDANMLGVYRRSFRHYTEQRLLTGTLFLGLTGMLFLGAFIVRYRLELILSFPVVAFIMTYYFHLAFQPRSPVQHPEKLFREPLAAVILLCAVLMGALLFVDVPLLYRVFTPTFVRGN